MKRLLDSQAVDTSYKIGLRTLVIAGIIINILVSIIVVMAAQKIFNNMPMLMIITIVVLLLLVTVEAYFLLGFLIKPINVAAKRLVRLAEGDLHSDLIHHTYLTETSVMVRALNSVVKVNNEYIEEIKRVLKELEDKHLFVEVSKEFKGDYAAIKESLLKIVDFLNNTMSIIKRSSYEVAGSSNQVSSGAIVLSQGAAEQASSIEELSASIAEIASQIKHNAENAKSARDKSDYAIKELENSTIQMNHLNTAMENIKQKSSEISKIMKIIDDIAFQTNILALNAAVEAARAGAAGKGFAVVADEVRNLAVKSAEAAKQTTSLIEETINAVETGANIAFQTAASLDNSSKVTKDSIELINSIADASGEQAVAITQINSGIEQISSVIQTNAATSQESAAVCQELSGQSNLLKEIVSEFSLKEDNRYSQISI